MPKSPELLSVTVQLRCYSGGVFFSSYKTMVSIGLFMDAVLYSISSIANTPGLGPRRVRSCEYVVLSHEFNLIVFSFDNCGQLGKSLVVYLRLCRGLVGAGRGLETNILVEGTGAYGLHGFLYSLSMLSSLVCL